MDPYHACDAEAGDGEKGGGVEGVGWVSSRDGVGGCRVREHGYSEESCIAGEYGAFAGMKGWIENRGFAYELCFAFESDGDLATVYLYLTFYNERGFGEIGVNLLELKLKLKIAELLKDTVLLACWRRSPFRRPLLLTFRLGLGLRRAISFPLATFLSPDPKSSLRRSSEY